MEFNKDRLALLAGIDNRDEYFGKTLKENIGLWEAEDEEEVPLDAEAGAEEEGEELDFGEEEDAADEEAVPKEDVIDALAPLLGVDVEELSALVTGDEGGDEEEGDDEEGGDEEEGDDEEFALESDVIVVDASEDDIDVHEARLRRAIRKEISSVIYEVRNERALKDIKKGYRTKSLAAVMGYKR